MYLSKLQKLQVEKCICVNCQMHLTQLRIRKSLGGVRQSVPKHKSCGAGQDVGVKVGNGTG